MTSSIRILWSISPTKQKKRPTFWKIRFPITPWVPITTNTLGQETMHFFGTWFFNDRKEQAETPVGLVLGGFDTDKTGIKSSIYVDFCLKKSAIFCLVDMIQKP